MSRKHRVGLGLWFAALGAVVGVVPVAPVGAVTNKNSAICRLERQERSNQDSRGADAATQALIKGNWPVAKKDLLALDTRTGRLDQQFIASLSSAPASVQSAAKALLRLVPAELNAVRNSTSASQFEASEGSIETTNVEHEATQVADYEKVTCGSGVAAS